MSELPRVLLARRLAAVEERLRAACRRAGRAREEVTLVAVTKSLSLESASLLPEVGLLDLGENRPQELWRKASSLPPSVRMIHSVDSIRLLDALEEEAARQERSMEVLLEVNASLEPSKHGFVPDEVPGLAPRIVGLKWLRVSGLMTMAALDADPEHCRPTFAELRRLCDRLASELGPSHPLPHLSMGMSNDFEVAVEEGATLVRLGTVLFEGMS
jgi:hypothetical protein